MNTEMSSAVRSAARFLAVAFGLQIFHAMAQVNTGAIVGTVRDTSGAVVAGAALHAINDGTGRLSSTTSNSEGIYSFPVLSVGGYTVTAEKQGFKKAVRKAVELQINQTARLDLVLEVGAVSEQVVVEAQVPVIQTESASLGSVISQREVLDLPLNKRNFSQLVTLAPGANFGASGAIGGGSRPDDPRPASAFFSNGTRESSNLYLIDGIDDYDRITTTIVIRPSIDAVQEFKVQTSMYSAEFGRNAGGVVNVSVKSGTNRFRGSAYEFLRNQALDARNFFAPITQPKPHYVLNQFGGTLGGPVVRDKTFIFASYEGYRERQGQTLTSTVPTIAMRNGNYSGLGTIYDPLSTQQNGATYSRTPFPNNIIPRERMDAPAATLAQLYPQPTTSALANNFVWSPVRPQNINQVDSRLDQQIGRGNLFGRYSWGHTSTTNPAYLPGKAQGAAGFSGPNGLNTQGAAAGYTYTFRPNLVSETRLGFTRLKRQVFPFFYGENLSQQVGIPNAQQDVFSSGLSTISISGFRGLGDASFLPIYQVENGYQVTENMNWTRGRHILKIGGQMIRPQIEQFQSANPAGLFSFDANFTNNPAAPAGTGNAFASFLMGYPASTSRTAQLSPNYLRWIEFSTYVQDDWKISSRLTLNLGLRYELITPAVSVNDQMTNFNLATARVDIAGVNGVSRTAGVETDYRGFAPRVGFAYTITPKTVLRGGYGVFYDSVPMFANLRPFPFLTTYSVVNSAFTVTNLMSDGFPANTWNIAQNAANPFGQVNVVPPNNPLSYVQQCNLTAQRSFGQNVGLTVAYVGTLGRKLRWVYDEDVPAPGPGAVQQRRPYYALVPNVTSILMNHAEASSTYHALQASLQKRLSNGLSFQISYTFSHWIDNAVSEAGYGSQGPNPQNLYDRRSERGNDPADIRQRFVDSGIYELPFGKGRRWANRGGLVSAVAGGWQLNGILAMQSGLPFTAAVATAVTNTGTSNRANCLANGSLPRGQRTLARFFDITQFATPALYQFGNCGRDTLYGPGLVNLDASVFRTFRFTETKALQFHGEMFNLANTPQFGLPSGSLGSATFGSISSLAGTMRQVQFALKLLF